MPSLPSSPLLPWGPQLLPSSLSLPCFWVLGDWRKIPGCNCHSRQASLNQTKHNKTCINCHMSMSSMAAILNTSKRNTLWTQHECDLNLWSDDHSIIALNFTSQYHTWDRLHTECPHIICRICACVSLWNRSEGSHPHGIFRPWARCDRGLAKFQSRLRIGACVFLLLLILHIKSLGTRLWGVRMAKTFAGSTKTPLSGTRRELE